MAQAKAQLARIPGGASSASGSTLAQEIAALQAEVNSPPAPGGAGEPGDGAGCTGVSKPERDGIFAAAIALVLAIIAAYLLDRTDRSVRDVDDVETLFDFPVLATIPNIRSIERKSAGVHTPFDAQEPYRMLRVNLDIARADVKGKVIMVTSALPAEGKSTVVRNLALSYREAGANVAVVEGDMRRPVLAGQFELAEQGAGFADALADERPLRTHEVPGTVEEPSSGGRIDVALAGHSEENPSVLLTRLVLPKLLLQLAETHDIVLVDSPPLLAVSDGLALLGVVDGVLVVVRPGRTTYPAAERLQRTVERLRGAPILGVVANGVQDELAASGYRVLRPAGGHGRRAFGQRHSRYGAATGGRPPRHLVRLPDERAHQSIGRAGPARGLGGSVRHSGGDSGCRRHARLGAQPGAHRWRDDCHRRRLLDVLQRAHGATADRLSAVSGPARRIPQAAHGCVRHHARS